MVKKLAVIREIFKGDHNAVAARKLSGTLNYYCTQSSSHKKQEETARERALCQLTECF